MKHHIHRVRSYFDKWNLHPLEIVAFVISLFCFMSNTLYVAYPDEFINLMGGQFIDRGMAPYRQFFDHHLPFAWHLASVFLLFSFGSFVIFRLIWGFFLFIGLFMLALWIRKNYRELYLYYVGFLVVYPLAAVYFWFHLFLADSLAVFFFSIIFWMLMAQSLTKRINYRAILFTSFLTFCLVFSSLTFIYMAAIIYLWQLYLVGWNKKNIAIFIGTCAAPYLVYLIYLAIIGALKDFYFANFVYNTTLYIDIPNYERGHMFNPIKFAMTLVFNFWGDYLPLLSKIKYFDLYLPIGVLAGLSSLTLIVLLFFRNVWLGLIFFFILSFSAPRSNIQNYKETDYQGSLFLVLGLICSFIVIYLFRKIKLTDELMNDVKRVAQFMIAVLLFFTFIFLGKNFYDKAFQRYTQKIPGIHDSKFTARFLDEIISPGDYVWMGPYVPDEQFYFSKYKLPGKYPSLLPQFRENEYTKSSFLQQFENHPPRIVIFQHVASIFGTPSEQFGKFFLEWLDKRYFRVQNKGTMHVLRSPSTFNVDGDLYIRNDSKEEVLQKLEDKGYIQY